MKVRTIDEYVTVKVHNQREDALVRIIKSQIAEIEMWFSKEDVSEDKARRICRRIVTEVDGLLTALYFLDCLERPVAAEELPTIKNRDLWSF